MAHEIDQTTGKAAIFVTGEPAWHQLGTVVSEAQTSDAALKLAGLDWTVEQWPLLAQCPRLHEGRSEMTVPSMVANVRSDTQAVLGVVGAGYKPFQNVEAFQFFDALVGEKLAMYETAGALKGGKRVWILARLPQEVRIKGDDIVKPYVLLSNGHDGSMALRMLPTTVRVVCQNTLNLALGRASSSEGLVIYHYESLTRRVEDAREKLAIVQRRVSEFTVEAQALAATEVSSDDLNAYFESLLPDQSDKSQQKMLEAWLANFEAETNTLPGIRGTLWAAYNAVSEWADHQKVTRGANEMDRLDNRLNSIWFGSANTIKQQAYAAALEIAISA